MEALDVKSFLMENLHMVKTAERDHIDRWLDEIREQLPMLDLRVEGIVDRIAGIQRRIRRMLDETLEEHGLSSGEWHVLGKLSRSPDLRRSAGELAAKVELTSKGKALYDRAVGAQAAKESIVAAALDPRQQDQLNDLLRRLMLEFERRESTG